ncbi:hypothetical protein NQZ68_004279 [Dissostichus eleginoides]|nr:hypothetical protein NQZ68_004279 [Dissostichus eleginoides]
MRTALIDWLMSMVVRPPAQCMLGEASACSYPEKDKRICGFALLRRGHSNHSAMQKPRQQD